MPMTGTGFSVRAAASCAITFGAIGFYLPFYPIWLSGRGFSGSEIAVIVGTPLFLRPLFSPLLTALADRFTTLGHAAAAYALVAASAVGMLLVVDGFMPVLMLSIVVLVFWNTLIPILDAVILAGVRRYGIDYARVRLWGSIGFIAGALLAGLGTRYLPGNGIIIAVVVLSLLGAVAAALLPAVSRSDSGGQSAGFRLAFRDPVLRRAIGAAGLVIASHAAFYALGSLYWREVGFRETTIAALWAFAVAVEIVLLWSAKLLTGWGARRFLLLGAAGGVLRWALFPFVQSPEAAFVLQALHAASFASTHLGVMMAIGAVMTPGHTARIQAIHQFVSGSLMGIATLAAGPIYAASVLGAFWMMAAMALGGGLLAAGLRAGLQPQSAASGGETRSPE